MTRNTLALIVFALAPASAMAPASAIAAGTDRWLEFRDGTAETVHNAGAPRNQTEAPQSLATQKKTKNHITA